MQLNKRFLRNRKAIVLSLLLLGITLIVVGPASAQVSPGTGETGFALIGAALAVGLACLGSGVAIYGATTGGSALMAERPEMSVWVLLFAGLGEGLAIYGFVIAILIISRL
ncbi:MAG TPA: ATP synthase subunit C [Candidatus Bathyarchaeia archaeon]|nr:ATP synthase subunit C [Candidatus Bathyarchaeia archaeon]